MAKTANINIRTEPEIKQRIETLFSQFGITVSDAVNIFFHQSLMHRGLPFQMQLPGYNNETLKLTENGYTPEFEEEVLRAAEEDYAAIRNGTAKLYTNTTEMFAQWDKEDDEDNEADDRKIQTV